MKHTLTRKNELNVSNWSGGSTTQLFLYPSTASYADRNFQVRVSCASVEQSPSNFTSLPGYHRILMPLTAPLKLVFENHEAALTEVELNPFESTEFEGEWNTVSHGACTDIGIMLAADGNWQGKLKAANSGKYECVRGFTGVYALADNVKIITMEKEHTLMSGDFLLLESETAGQFELITQKENAAILVQVFK